MRNPILIAIGANLSFGESAPRQTIEDARNTLAEMGFVLISFSKFYATPCFPAGAGPDYVNAAAVLGADPMLNARSILGRLHAVEEMFGRRRETRWGGRTLDLDLLAMGDSVLPDRAEFERWRDLPADQQRVLTPDELILPHPRIQDRAFVLVPLMDVAPDWCHPVSGLTVRQMCAALPSRADVVAMDP